MNSFFVPETIQILRQMQVLYINCYRVTIKSEVKLNHFLMKNKFKEEKVGENT